MNELGMELSKSVSHTDNLFLKRVPLLHVGLLFSNPRSIRPLVRSSLFGRFFVWWWLPRAGAASDQGRSQT
jgi:hypothetical protein